MIAISWSLVNGNCGAAIECHRSLGCLARVYHVGYNGRGIFYDGFKWSGTIWSFLSVLLGEYHWAGVLTKAHDGPVGEGHSTLYYDLKCFVIKKSTIETLFEQPRSIIRMYYALVSRRLPMC